MSENSILLRRAGCSLALFFLHALSLPFPAHLSFFLPASGASLHVCAVGAGSCLYSFRRESEDEHRKSILVRVHADHFAVHAFVLEVFGNFAQLQH